MDPSYNFASKDDIWRLQNDMKSVYAVQEQHADRISRLERRCDDDGRAKSVWGTASSAPSVRGGTPHQETSYNPAAEAFRNFDQDNSNSLLGSLHIEPDEEPRRGTSRANSVRFDVSALHGGQLTHTSRSSSEFFPIRTGSAFGSHPLTERSSSHKSEGRQSSAGVSTHSTPGAALNGLAFDAVQDPVAVAADRISRPAPGLFLLGPCPSIVRCWLGSNFSNDTLLYAAVCTGASRSMVTRSLVEEAGLAEHITTAARQSDGATEQPHPEAKLQVFFPEATIRQPSLGSSAASPAPPQLPVITATLAVIDAPSDAPAIQLFLGSDVLRARSADVLLSQDRLVLSDDDQNRVNVPLIRPESSSAFKNLVTMHMSSTTALHSRPAPGQSSMYALDPPRSMRSSPVHAETKSRSRVDWSRARMGRAPDAAVSPHPKETDPQPAPAPASAADPARYAIDDPDGTAGTTPVTPGPSEPDESWSGTWRRQPSASVGAIGSKATPKEAAPPPPQQQQQQQQPTTTFSSVASSGGARGGAPAGRGMKVLKTRRMSSNTTRSTSNSVAADASPRPEAAQPGWVAQGQPVSAVTTPLEAPPGFRGAFSDARTPTKPSNPVGGASAFGWLNSAGGRG